MFTGLVEDSGRIERVNSRSDCVVFAITPVAMPVAEFSPGDSVAIDGVCLTVTQQQEAWWQVLAGDETLRRTTLGQRKVGDLVHLERALRVGDRLGGHIVQGHVDGVGKIVQRRDAGANLEIRVHPPHELLRYIVEKGSIAVDGISLTVNQVDQTSFALALIPHTLQKTNLVNRRIDDELNLEVDVIAKYVEKLAAGYKP